ncbi:2-polyprenylphenol hydroxylase and related flavodoxin oxidoreductases / CDP-6-deoxy-delta-3,4-glucoseen reductase-like [hydrothermal vent metagenome]|uniref:2-polyprenylphenol hydroxylase and related flavodoxin oxidoreductases / CDP-6-deoxy-delta-3,4-glucoseen reductase-like n=1 Tax=hydrothermal vent metagenome TaxID=652676 RepID=A0A3B0YK57_9ZZZZ
MPHKITFLPDESSFECQHQETILESALRSGRSPNYGCSNGNCGNCKGKLLEGEVEPIRNFDYQLSSQEKAEAIFLMCCHSAKSDLTIEVKTAHEHTDIPIQTTTAKIKKIHTDSTGMMLIPLQTPRTGTLRFLAGQTIELLAATGSLGHYYVGSCPCDDRNLLLHIPATSTIKLIDEAVVAKEYFKSGLQITIHGPQGDFTLEETPPRPALIIAEEHAFAAAKSLIEHAIALEYEQPLTLVRFNHNEKPYLHNLCRSWNDALDDFNYICVQTNNTSDSITAEFTIIDLQTILKQQSDSVIYITGTPAFCEEWKKNISPLAENPIVKYATL